MNKRDAEILAGLEGSHGVGKHRYRRVGNTLIPAPFEADGETDKERAQRRRICHGIWKKDCNACKAYEVALERLGSVPDDETIRDRDV